MKDSGRKNRRDSETSAEVPDFNFEYNDSDTLDAELAEWYTYSEEPEFVWNLNAFKCLLIKKYPNKNWKELNRKEKQSHILSLIELTDIDRKQTRDDACRSILYLCQGTFAETENTDDYHSNLIENVILLYECDIFNVFLELFIFEINNINENILADSKYAPSIADNVDLRVILSVLYTILEVVRLYDTEVDNKRINLNQNFGQKYQEIKEQLRSELSGVDEAFILKNEYRKLFNLAEITENPKKILNEMTPATPPPNPVDIANEIQSNNPSNKRKKNINDSNNSVNGLTKQTKGIDSDDLSISNGINNSSGKLTQFGINTSRIINDTNEDNESENTEISDANLDKKENQVNESENESENLESAKRPSSPPPLPTENQIKVLEAANDAISVKINFSYQSKSLPWRPKVRISELEMFLDQERKKFLRFGDLSNDLDTLIGLPKPIHESIRILKQHLYTSLSDEQIKLEEKFLKFPMSTREVIENEIESPAEILFSSLLNNLPQNLICLLKILLTSIPQIRPKADSLQIMSDLFPEELYGSHYLTVKLDIDSNRHKEIIIKGISGILLLMLKHFKTNHIYQFEFTSQHLLFANCVPLILKIFNINISSFVQSKNNNCNLDFPNCVIGPQPYIDAEELENGDLSTFRWRNVFSCINLLRVLNKLTKYKRSRIMMLVIFKSAPIFKKMLRIKQPMLQYYALKLLKMQTRHLGRQWRKTNMSTMSAIYQKVRHRLNDDWAFGNEQETQGWDFQSDECAIRTKIDKYIQRKYKCVEEPLYPEYAPMDNSLYTCLRKEIDIPDDFENNYEQWLDEEVFSNQINWDLIINDKKNNLLY